MAHVISSLTPDNSTDASFRAWGLGISTALKSLFTFVTQTGEINWSTVTTPSFSGDIRGFEIYRLNDSLQSTTPIFIKIQYGSGSQGVVLPAIYMSVGKSVNGSGTLNTILLPEREIISAYSNPSASVSNCYFGNGDGSCMIISLWPNDSSFQTFGSYLAFERSRNNDGTPNDSAVWWQMSGTTISTGDINECTDYTAETRNTLLFGCVPVLYPLDSNIALSNGVTTPVFTGSVITPQRVAWVPTTILACAQSDLGIGTVASALIGGVDYISTGAAGQYSDTGKQQFAVALLRWD